MKSETIGKLAEALSKAQGEMGNAHKDKNNPFFKSSYADLASVWDACKEPLSKNGLSVTQTFSSTDNKIILETILMHSSGEFISSSVPINPVKNDPQSIGSAITYYRRFSLSALVGVTPAEAPTKEQNLDDSDDDGNIASGKIDQKKTLNNDAPQNDSGVENSWVITPVEIVKIKELAERLGWPMTQVTSYYQNSFGVEKISQLNKQQFEQLFYDLKHLVNMEEVAKKGK